MRTFLWMLGGGLLAGLAAAVIGFSLPAFLPISQAEGAYAMGIAFFHVPAATLAGAILGLVLRLSR